MKSRISQITYTEAGKKEGLHILRIEGNRSHYSNVTQSTKARLEAIQKYAKTIRVYFHRELLISFFF